MPYGRYRRNYRGRTHGYRKRPAWKKTTTMASKPVKRKVAVPTAYALRSLGRQVMLNKRALQGKMQTNIQQAPILDPSNDEPIAFDITDMSGFINADKPGAIFYQWGEAGSAITNAGNWSRAGFNSNPFHLAENQDYPDTGGYFPVSTTLKFRITWDGNPSNKRVAFHLFTLKPNAFVAPLPGAGSTLMPQCLEFLKDMADPTSNQFSRTYFRLVKSKFVFFNSAAFEREGEPDSDPDDAPPIGNTAKIKYCSFHFGPKFFGHAQVRQRLTRPTVGELGIAGDVVDGNFGPGQRILGGRSAGGKSIGPYWMMISTDNTRGAVVSPQVTCLRINKFRDYIGQGPM